MIISVKSKLWSSIYYPLRDHFLEGENVSRADKVSYLEECFAGMGIIMHRDEPHGSWSHAEFTNDVDLVELVLRWS